MAILWCLDVVLSTIKLVDLVNLACRFDTKTHIVLAGGHENGDFTLEDTIELCS